MPTTNSYGAYNPAAVDPYPIETDLAKIAVGGNPENAANLLDLYQLQRTTDAANYGHEMGVQHDFAKQQLAQQLQEQYLKSGQEALKTRGGVSLLNSQAPGSLGAGFGPDQINTIETGLSNAQDAATAEKVGSAAYHGVQAGFPANLTRLQGMSGGLFDTQGVPLQLQVEGMKQAGKNARGGGGAAGDKFTLPIKGLFTDDAQQIPYGIKTHLGEADDVIRTKIARARQIVELGNPTNGTGTPGGVAPTDVVPSGRTAAPPRTSATSLPNNPNAAPQGGPQAASSQYIRDPKTQGAAKVGFQHLTPAAKADVGAQVQLGGVMPIVPLRGGGVGYVGKSGTVHVIPPPGSN